MYSELLGLYLPDYQCDIKVEKDCVNRVLGIDSKGMEESPYRCERDPPPVCQSCFGACVCLQIFPFLCVLLLFCFPFGQRITIEL